MRREAEQPWSSKHHSTGTREDQPTGVLEMVKFRRFRAGRKTLSHFRAGVSLYNSRL